MAPLILLFTGIFIFVGTIVEVDCIRLPRSSPFNTTLTICSVIETAQNSENTTLVYNYLRAASAIDMAIEYSNDAILPPDVQLKFYYKNGGKICAANNEAIRSALDWIKEGVSCDVYIGPGEFNNAFRKHTRLHQT